MGITGSMHAWQQERFAGQISRLSARLPLSRVLLHQNIVDVLSAGSGRLAHGHTFQVSRSFTLGAPV